MPADTYLGSLLPKKLASDMLTVWRYGFEPVFATTPDPAQFSVVALGTGQAVSQTGGNLVMTTGTAVGESIFRSTRFWTGPLNLRWLSLLSQRIANQEFYVELVDVLGDGLQLIVNGSTSLTVVWPGNCPFTASSVGQAMYIGASTVAGSGPGSNSRGTIASVNGQAVTYTMPGGWTAGTGTCSVYGWNYCHTVYDGVTAGSGKLDCQRNGYANGDTVSTIATTAAPGSNSCLVLRDTSVTFMDNTTTAVASNATIDTLRWARMNKIPVPADTPLYLQIRVANTAVAASTTTFSVNFVGVEPMLLPSFNLAGLSSQAYNAPLPIVINNTPGFNLSLVGGVAGATIVPSGGAKAAAVTAVAGGESAVDYNAQAWAALNGSGATIADTNGMGAVCSFAVNCAAWTVGASAGLDVYLQWSPDNGSNFIDIWQCEAITGVTATPLIIPPLYIPGRRRMRWVNRGGAATTATITVTSTRLSLVPNAHNRQFFDRTAGVLAGTLANATATFDFSGCQNLTALVTIGAATTPATYQWQVAGSDGVNFANVGPSVAAVASSTVAIVAPNVAGTKARLIVTGAATGQTGTVIALLGS